MSGAVTLFHGLAALGGTLAGGVLALAAEQAAAALLRQLWLGRRPMLDAPAARYERSLFTPRAWELQLVWALLGVAGIGFWLGLARHPALHAAAGVAWMLALALDLWATQSVEVNAHQVAWRRGAAPLMDAHGRPQRTPQRQPVRRLPLLQVAHVHVVERPGTVYLALSFHNGQAVKLPRTSRRFGGAAVRRMAAWIEQHQAHTAAARRSAQAAEAQAQARAMRVDPAALAPVEEAQPVDALHPLPRPLPGAAYVDDGVIDVEPIVISTVPARPGP